MGKRAQTARKRKRVPSKWHHVTLRCPVELDRAVEMRCVELDITKAVALRQAFTRWLGKRAPAIPPPPPYGDRRPPATDEELDRRALEMDLDGSAA